MKKTLILLAVVATAYYAYHKVISMDPVRNGPPYAVKIEQLKLNPTHYVGSEIKLENVKVVHSKTLLNHSLSMIQDGTDSVLMLSDKPYRVGENVNVKGRYEILYSNGTESVDLFVADSSSR